MEKTYCWLVVYSRLNSVPLFEKLIDQEENIDFIYPDAMQILKSGYLQPTKIIQKTLHEPKATEDFYKAAARNGKEIPETVLRKMHEDRGE
jgi:hypothetical protein